MRRDKCAVHPRPENNVQLCCPQESAVRRPEVEMEQTCQGLHMALTRRARPRQCESLQPSFNPMNYRLIRLKIVRYEKLQLIDSETTSFCVPISPQSWISSHASCQKGQFFDHTSPSSAILQTSLSPLTCFFLNIPIAFSARSNIVFPSTST